MALLFDASSLQGDASLLASTDESVASLDFSGHDGHDLKMANKVVRARDGIFITLSVVPQRW